jgi:16S rRNA (guanine527-N7)-methyltransferase
MELIRKYFPDLTNAQYDKLSRLGDLYSDWNGKVNLISRKDMDHFYERHVLHSLSLAYFVRFRSFAQVLDVGTGGGFPGIPLAIIFPETNFTLVDSIRKKVRVVDDVAAHLSLSNVRAIHSRAENIKGGYDYIVSRAVTAMPRFVGWTAGLLKKGEKLSPDGGIWYLKGGDLKEELAGFSNYKIFNLADVFEEEFFETKKLVYLPSNAL